MRSRLKICGITRFEDALLAVKLGADALGFVFYPASPRFIQASKAADIISRLPPFVTTVGLFVNSEQHEIDQIVEVSGVDIIQLHGDESPEFCAKQIKRVVKALPVACAEDLHKVRLYPCAVLLDAKAPDGVYGGTGKSFDWTLLNDFDHQYPLILAGGLNSDNIAAALSCREWFAVDVSSGVESEKGIKDREKMTKLCKKVHQFNCRV